MSRRASQTHRKLPIERSKPTGDLGRVNPHIGPPSRFYGRADWPELEAEARSAWERNRELILAQARASGQPDERPWSYFMFDRPRAETIPGPLRDRLLAEGRLSPEEAAMMAWSHAQLAYARIAASRPGETTADWLADPGLIEKSLALNGWNVFTEETIAHLRRVNAPAAGDHATTTEEEVPTAP